MVCGLFRKCFGVSAFRGCNLVGERCELLRISVVSGIFRSKTNFTYCTLVSPEPSHRKWSYFSDALEGRGSSVYEHALKFQRPSTIKYSHKLKSCVSLIGRVIRPLKIFGGTYEVGAYTLLRVQDNSYPDSGLCILLQMWGCMAEECLNHVKESDLVYVNGSLRSYTKGVEEGILYQVRVKEINHVAPIIGQESSGKTENSIVRGEDIAEKRRSRLHMWQVFFASPYEWKDLRKSKTNPRQPDFKHKSTGEALWLSRSDPPWLRQQLLKHDSATQDHSTEVKTPYLTSHSL